MAEEEKKENWCLRQWKTLKDSLHNNRLAKKQGKENFKERERAYKRLLKEEKERIEKEGEYHPDPDSYLELHHVNKVYDGYVQAVSDFSLKIKEHEFIVFVGPSGCGKSTTLRMIAGLEDITTGELYIGGEYANNRAPKDRDMAMVFQSYALYPHLNVYENMAFSLKIRHEKKEEIYRRVKIAAKILELGDYLDRKPKELSGGQRQRVALGRAIVRNAKVFLMDEPLSNLDAKLRVQMRSSIVRLHNELHATTIYVTHDQTEAMTMATRIVVMKDGEIQQIGTPQEIFDHPANSFVATFIGAPAMNLLEAEYRKVGSIHFPGGASIPLTKGEQNQIEEFYENYENNLKCQIEEELFALKQEYEEEIVKHPKKKQENPVFISERLEKLQFTLKRMQSERSKDAIKIIYGIRPEDVRRSTSPLFTAKIDVAELMGREYDLHFVFGEKELITKTDAREVILVGDEIGFSFDNEKAHIFDPISTKAIY